MKTHEKGFTLLELVVVIALIVIIASVSLPNLLSAKKHSNEASAIHYMKSWITAQELYYKNNGYYADADEQLVAANLLTVKKGDGNGYKFALDNPKKSLTWWGRGWPELPGTSGDRYFYLGADGVVRFSHSRHAHKNDPPVN